MGEIGIRSQSIAAAVSTGNVISDCTIVDDGVGLKLKKLMLGIENGRWAWMMVEQLRIKESETNNRRSVMEALKE